jgi:pyruvate, orthophosphate dikinase
MPFVYAFAEGSRDQKDLLGGKGANLAEMTRLGLPVPPGFTISTQACRAFRSRQQLPAGLMAEVADHVVQLERTMGRQLGHGDDPLLVSVRSGAKYSMPGMMETVLNIGLNDASVRGLAQRSGDERFAWDCYRRLVQMFGRTVLDVPPDRFEQTIDTVKQHRGTADDLGLTVSDLQHLVEAFCSTIQEHTGYSFPQDPSEQLRLAIMAVFRSWDGDRARLYRRQERIPDDLGTAVNVQAMVFGNMGPDSGTGVAFTRDPASGRPGVYGDYLTNAQGEDVVAGIRNTLALAELQRLDPAAYHELVRIMGVLERHYRDMCDIEFTVERGQLWMLQTRVGKRTPEAAFSIAVQLTDEGLIDLDEALDRVTGAQLARLMFPHFDTSGVQVPLAHGVAASPGAAVGRVVFDSKRAAVRAVGGDPVILVRRETTPDDLGGMIASQGVLTSRGGKTSHAAVVARGMGKPCVVGAERLEVDLVGRRFTTSDGQVVVEGDVVSIDGTTGAVYAGAVPVVPSPVVRYFEGEVEPQDDPLVHAVDRLIQHADKRRRLGVKANADIAEDAARARRFGAEGIGLARTEHMFLGERKDYVVRLVLAADDDERDRVYGELLPLQREDFRGLLEAMDGLPVTIRLLDPPLHEFLPDLTDLSVRVALEDARGHSDTDHHRLLEAVRRMHEANPMMGLRGVRLGLVLPGLYGLQVRALAEAAADLIAQGRDPRPEIMVPLVATVTELERVRKEAAGLVREVAETRGLQLDIPIGTMIELPRAALTAGEIAQVADFFSFGTNDLTQTTWGFSRDDAEGAFFTTYLEAKIFGVSPFETIDEDGVGRLVAMAVQSGREARPEISMGVCGEHGGDPTSIHLFDRLGLDYVSCSPFRVPVARLEAGRASLSVEGSDSR